MKRIASIIFFSLVGQFALLGMASATTVENEIHVKASTGGNSANSVTEGKGKASVFIETVVDGEVVQHVEEEVVSEAGEPVEIQKQVEYTDGSEKVISETPAKVKSQEQGKEEIIQEEQVEEQEEKTIVETKPLVISIVEFVRNLFSRFFA